MIKITEALTCDGCVWDQLFAQMSVGVNERKLAPSLPFWKV